MDINKLLNTIQNSSDIHLVVVSAEGCEQFQGQLYTKIADTIAEHNLSDVQLYQICYVNIEKLFPRPATQVVYFFKPGDTTPCFARAHYNVEKHLLDDIDIVRQMASGSSYEEAAFKDRVHEFTKVQNMLDSEHDTMHVMPSTFQRVRNFAKELWIASKESLHGRPVLTDANTAYTRLQICESCPFYKNNVCSRCGCVMSLKVHVTTSKCPEGKW
jgi:hypothetical protein